MPTPLKVPFVGFLCDIAGYCDCDTNQTDVIRTMCERRPGCMRKGHVCFCCPAEMVQPTRLGRYGEERPRSARQTEQRGARRTARGGAHTHGHHGEESSAQQDFPI